MTRVALPQSGGQLALAASARLGSSTLTSRVEKPVPDWKSTLTLSWSISTYLRMTCEQLALQQRQEVRAAAALAVEGNENREPLPGLVGRGIRSAEPEEVEESHALLLSSQSTRPRFCGVT